MGEDAAWRSALSSAGTPRAPGSARVSGVTLCCRRGLYPRHRGCLGGTSTHSRLFSRQPGDTASLHKRRLLQRCNTMVAASAAYWPLFWGHRGPRSRPSMHISLQRDSRVCLNKHGRSDWIASSSHVVAEAPTIRSLAGSPLAGFVWNFPRRVVTIESHRTSN